MSEATEWLTVEDVARMLDLKPKTIYILASEGCSADRRIPSHRLGPRGGKLRFHREDVTAYIEATRTVTKVSHRTLKILEPKTAGSTRRRP
jgi:excisionase family DNA binding protein